MARCKRCNKFLFKTTSSGYCQNCDELISIEKQKKAEAAAKAKAEQKLLLQSSFELRHGIHFGDDTEQVMLKETNFLDEKYKVENRIAYRGTLAGVGVYGQTIYTFNELGLLINMAYSYFSYNEKEIFKLQSQLLKSLIEKYGEPVYVRDTFNDTLHTYATGEKYSRIINYACQYDEISLKTNNNESNLYLHGWIINYGSNDVVIHLRETTVGFYYDEKDAVEIGYTIVQHSTLLDYVSQDQMRIVKEMQAKEKERNAYYRDL